MGEAKRKREASARIGAARHAGHWSELSNSTPCSRGNDRRYCCDQDAWDHIGNDFGDAAFCQGGFIDWFGEPLDPDLCRAAAEHGVDPHDVFDDRDLAYKPHKTWWKDHLHHWVPVIAARIKATRAVLTAITEQASIYRASNSLNPDEPLTCVMPAALQDQIYMDTVTAGFDAVHIEIECIHSFDVSGEANFLIYRKGSFKTEPIDHDVFKKALYPDR